MCAALFLYPGNGSDDPGVWMEAKGFEVSFELYINGSVLPTTCPSIS